MYDFYPPNRNLKPKTEWKIFVKRVGSENFLNKLKAFILSRIYLYYWFLVTPSSLMASTTSIPLLPYRLFFLYIEPISALVGAYYAAIRPAEYLHLLSISPSKASPLNAPVPTPVAMSLYQLANLYLLFALNEHLVLSSTNSLRTWRRLLFCLLVADIGHLLTMAPLGHPVFWRVWEWNAMVWGSVGFVYAGASMRTCFLLGLGLETDGRTRKND